MRIWKNVFRPVVQDEVDLRRYVVSVTLFAWAVAMALEAANEWTGFVDWNFALREFALTTLTVLVIAVPVGAAIGRAHLELHRARKAAERLSLTDPLTGLANRRAFYDAAAKLDAGALALVIADIDRFKRVNDRYGHAAGDEVIKAVAQRMQEDLGDLGAVARIGGEEFALVSAGRRAGEVATRLEQFRQRVADTPVGVGGQPIYITVSIGFAARGDLDFDGLYAAADKALYVAKAAGRDRVVDFDYASEAAQIDPAMRRTG